MANKDKTKHIQNKIDKLLFDLSDNILDYMIKKNKCDKEFSVSQTFETYEGDKYQIDVKFVRTKKGE